MLYTPIDQRKNMVDLFYDILTVENCREFTRTDVTVGKIAVFPPETECVASCTTNVWLIFHNLPDFDA